MIKKCVGCGVELQDKDSKQIGYTPKINSDYCQRCFRLSHYGDVMIDMKEGIDPDLILEKVSKMNCLVLWVVDIFDFEASLINGLNRHLFGKDIIMIATKRDLLPSTLGNEKLGKFIYNRLNDYGIKIKDLICTGLNFDTTGIFEVIEEYYEGRDICVLGMANAGKSTLLNNLMNSSSLTSSRYPGTTLDFNPIQIGKYNFIDTPGLKCDSSLIMYVDNKDLKDVIPQNSIKPLGFQCRDNQSFAIGGLCRVDLFGLDKTSVVFYMSNAINIHRGKVSNADKLWETNYGKDLKPTLNVKYNDFVNTELKMENEIDIAIDGLGWISVKGPCTKAVIKTVKGCKVITRKVML